MGKSGINKVLIGFIGVLIILLCIPIAMDLRNPISVSAATDYLEDRDYVVFSAADFALVAKEATAYAAVQNANAAVLAAQYAAGNASIAATKVDLFNSAEVFVFPNTTDAYVLFAAEGTANTFSNWTEIQDNNLVTLSSKFAANAGYIADLYMYQVTLNDSQWLVEIAYGDNKTSLARIMFNTDYMDIAQIKSRKIPAGATIYYRVMCDAAPTEYMSIGFRYFYE